MIVRSPVFMWSICCFYRSIFVIGVKAGKDNFKSLPVQFPFNLKFHFLFRRAAFMFDVDDGIRRDGYFSPAIWIRKALPFSIQSASLLSFDTNSLSVYFFRYPVSLSSALRHFCSLSSMFIFIVHRSSLPSEKADLFRGRRNDIAAFVVGTAIRRDNKKPGRPGWYPVVVPASTSPSLNTTLILRPATGCDKLNSLVLTCVGLPAKSFTKNNAFMSLVKISRGLVPGGVFASLTWNTSFPGEKVGSCAFNHSSVRQSRHYFIHKQSP